MRNASVALPECEPLYSVAYGTAGCLASVVLTDWDERKCVTRMKGHVYYVIS